MNYFSLLITAPGRAWAWGQRHPERSIGYGLILLGTAFVSKTLLVGIATISIISGLVATFKLP